MPGYHHLTGETSQCKPVVRKFPLKIIQLYSIVVQITGNLSASFIDPMRKFP